MEGFSGQEDHGCLSFENSRVVRIEVLSEYVKNTLSKYFEKYFSSQIFKPSYGKYKNELITALNENEVTKINF